MQFLLQYKIDYYNTFYNLFVGQKGVAKDPPRATPSTSNVVQNEDNHGSSKYSKLDDEEKEKVKKMSTFWTDVAYPMRLIMNLPNLRVMNL